MKRVAGNSGGDGAGVEIQGTFTVNKDGILKYNPPRCSRLQHQV